MVPAAGCFWAITEDPGVEIADAGAAAALAVLTITSKPRGRGRHGLATSMQAPTASARAEFAS